MELICRENTSIVFKECRSLQDPVFTDDERVFKNLLQTQNRYTIKSSYFKTVQNDIEEYMREEVAKWMQEVRIKSTMSAAILARRDYKTAY